MGHSGEKSLFCMGKRVAGHGAGDYGQIRGCAILATIFIIDHGANILAGRPEWRDAFHAFGAARRFRARVPAVSGRIDSSLVCADGHFAIGDERAMAGFSGDLVVCLTGCIATKLPVGSGRRRIAPSGMTRARAPTLQTGPQGIHL